MEGFRFFTEVQVRFAETDAQGIAHHAVYLVWFEVARIAYLARFDGGYPGLQRQGIEALTIETHVRYREAVRFDDRLAIHARCGDVRGARFRFEYAVEHAGRLVASGWTGHACVDARTFRPTRMPAWLTEAVTRAEAPEG
ncbi:MAG: acyl-CoA thioesterase [Actinobacteria bacterium]|nr:acyl-CoA thioesterase [Actinomycetota bacterium]